MFNLSGSETVFLLLLALIILGPEKLPEALRKFGKAYGDFKRMATGFQAEVRTALDEPMREMRETADAMRQAAQLEGLDEFVNDAKRSFRFQPDNTSTAAPTADGAPPAEPAGDAPATTDKPTEAAASQNTEAPIDTALSVLDGDIVPSSPPREPRRSNTQPGPRFASAAPRPTHRPSRTPSPAGRDEEQALSGSGEQIPQAIDNPAPAPEDRTDQAAEPISE